MIDIDKYEGHSTEYSYEIISVDDDKNMYATYALLNDAPLLLAEIERLRKQLSKAKGWVKDYLTDINGNYISYQHRVVHTDFIQQMGEWI